MDGPNGTVIRDIAGAQLAAAGNSRSTDIALDAMVDASRQSPIIDVGVSDGGSVIATAAKDGGVSILRADAAPRYGVWGAMPMPSLEPVAKFEHGDKLGAVTTWSAPPALFLSHDGRFVASQSQGLKTNAVGGLISYEPLVRVWDVKMQAEVARFRPDGGMLLSFARKGNLAIGWSLPSIRRPPRADDQKAPAVPQITIWKLLTDSSSPEQVKVPALLESSATVKATLFAAHNGSPSTGIALDPNGKRAAWVGTDGQLRTALAGTPDVTVVADLRPLAHSVYTELAALTAASMGHKELWERLGKAAMPVDPIAEYAADLDGVGPAPARADPGAPAP